MKSAPVLDMNNSVPTDIPKNIPTNAKGYPTVGFLRLPEKAPKIWPEQTYSVEAKRKHT